MQAIQPRVALVTPSRTYVMPDDAGKLDLERLEVCAEVLEALSFRVVRTSGGFRNHRQFGGTDEERAAEFNSFLLDPGIDLVLPVRGGYGMARILPKLRFPEIALRKPLAMGFSDFTAFNLALFAKTGLPSWQGPLAGGLAPGHTSPVSQRNFLRALSSDTWDLAWDQAGEPISAGVKGTLWGGNLSILVSLLGTPYFLKPEQVRGGILFLEDVGEPPYRIDRMLTQLLKSGVLGRQGAVVLGDFSGVDRHLRGEGDLRFGDVVSYFRAKLSHAGIPVLAGLPFGHTKELTAIPFGVEAELEASSSGSARLISGSVPAISRGREVLEAALSSIERV